MSFIALYAENASVVGTYAERAAAVRAAIAIAMRRPDLSPEIGIAELDDADGHVIAPFVSASDLLAADDPDAVAAADRFDAQPAPRTAIADATNAVAEAALRLRDAMETRAEPMESHAHDVAVKTAEDGTIRVTVKRGRPTRRRSRDDLRPPEIIATFPDGGVVRVAVEPESEPPRPRRAK
jgi:hypothetical protein